MANTKVTKAVLANDAVGLDQLEISNDPSNGQALTYVASSNDLQWATISGGASDINGLSDAKTFGTSSIMIGDTTTGTIDAANYNTGLGIDIFAALTSGDGNSFVGYKSGESTTTGNYNVSVGANSLQDNTTGSENTSVGYGSMWENTTGTANTSIGYGALDQNTTASNNTAVGRFALGANTTGTYNTALGSNAGSSMTTPTYNTLVGYNAGQGSHPLTTGSSCTMVGSLARPSGTLGNANGENVFGFNMSANGTNTTTLGSGGSGLYASHGSNSWTSISDERYKKDIVDSEVGLSFINDLRPRNFKWKTCSEVPSDTPRYEEDSDELINPNLTGVMHGFIAQEVKAVIDNHSEVPNNQLIWKQDPDGIQGLAEGELVPVLVKAVQELSAKNDALEARIKTLESN